MGGGGGAADTVVGEMDAAPPSSDRRPARRRPLDRRTLAICTCLALVAALLAALAASVFLSDEDTDPATSNALELGAPIDPGALLDVELLTVDGAPTTLAAHLGPRPMVVNLWAQSCVPCVEEMPLLEDLHQAREDLDVFGVDIEDRLDKAVAMAQQTGITYPWVQDTSGDFFFEARAAGMPTTLLVNPDGTVIAAKTGPFENAEDLAGWVDSYLGPANP